MNTSVSGARQQPLENQLRVVLSSQGGSPHYNRQDCIGLFCLFLKGCTAQGEVGIQGGRRLLQVT